jgi:hypothetical protein
MEDAEVKVIGSAGLAGVGRVRATRNADNNQWENLGEMAKVFKKRN